MYQSTIGCSSVHPFVGGAVHSSMCSANDVASSVDRKGTNCVPIRIIHLLPEIRLRDGLTPSAGCDECGHAQLQYCPAFHCDPPFLHDKSQNMRGDDHPELTSLIG